MHADKLPGYTHCAPPVAKIQSIVRTEAREAQVQYRVEEGQLKVLLSSSTTTGAALSVRVQVEVSVVGNGTTTGDRPPRR